MSKGLAPAPTRFSQQRRTLPPMRSKPLIATLETEPAAMAVDAQTCWAWARSVLGRRPSTDRPSREAPTLTTLADGDHGQGGGGDASLNLHPLAALDRGSGADGANSGAHGGSPA
eukprot:10783786-Heterocapsa_arctica.AAC.1